jgi:hypothetical protein
MTLNVGLDVSFDNMYDWKGIREKLEIESTKAYIINDKTSIEFSNGCDAILFIYLWYIL